MAGNPKMQIIKPQPKQAEFLACPADIAIYGGAAGGGKTFALLMEAMRYPMIVKNFSTTVFRRQSKQITEQGGLWDASMALYANTGMRNRIGFVEHITPIGNRISFRHLDHEKDKFGYQGTEIPLICYDELTHFSKATFLYMLSRNRSTCGVRPYIRATTNPDSTSFVRDLIDWWIGDDGFAIDERSGVIRWLVVVNDTFLFFESEQDACDAYPDIPPKSLTFIPSKLSDNQALINVDKGYLANLMALSEFDRQQLLYGNWNVNPNVSLIKDDWWVYYNDIRTKKFDFIVHSWDTAFKANASADPTACTVWGVAKEGFYLLDVLNKRLEYPDLKDAVIKMASQDNPDFILIEDKASGQSLIQDLKRSHNFPIIAIEPENDKVNRLSTALVHIEAGNVYLPELASWVKEFKKQCELFPQGDHDDMVDSMSQFLNWAKNNKRLKKGEKNTTLDDIINIQIKSAWAT